MTHIVGGVNAAFIGVTDLNRHVDVFVDQLGWTIEIEGRIAAAEAEQLWGPGLGDLDVAVMTAEGAQHGRMVLIRVPSEPVPTHPRQADFGFIAINMYTHDIEASYREQTAAGCQWATPPATWEVPLGEKVVSVTQGFLLAPDATDVVFVQPAQARGTAAWDRNPERQYTEVTSVVCHVPEFDAELAFWGPSGMGLDQWYDVSLSHPGLEAMANLPPNTVMRLAFLAGSTTARIEITRVQGPLLGTDLRKRQRTARHLGHSGWLLEVHDLQSAVDEAVAKGGTVHAAPHRGPEFLFGGRSVAFLDTPNGLPVTFVQHNE